MGLSPINSQLANMEFMLYGGASGLNSSVPSMYNGYMSSLNNYNPAFMGGYNPAMSGYYNPSIFTNPQTAAATAAGLGAAAAGAGAATAGISEQDLNVLADYASKINDEGETFLGACTGGLTFAAFENAQNVKHWKNAWKGMRDADKMFDLRKSNIKALWEGKETREMMQNAYSQAQAASRRLYDKKGWLSQMFARNLSKEDKKVVRDLLKDLDNAIKTNNKGEIIKITQKLKDARGIDGRIMTPFNALFGKENLSAQARIDKKAETSAKEVEQVKNALKTGESWFTTAKFMKEFKGWFIFELAIEGLTKVLPTYMEGGADSGNKQLVQSGVKAAASAAGWAAGRLAGGWLGTKVGAAVGSAICPGIGTAVGAVIGFAGGCVGSWLAGKGIKALFGKDESEKLAEAKLKKTQEGQAQLLQLAYQKAQEGEAPREVVNSLNNIMRQVA